MSTQTGSSLTDLDRFLLPKPLIFIPLAVALVTGGTMKVYQGLCHCTDSPSERPAVSSRHLPEQENVPLSLRPREPSLQIKQETETAVKTQVLSPDFDF